MSTSAENGTTTHMNASIIDSSEVQTEEGKAHQDEESKKIQSEIPCARTGTLKGWKDQIHSLTTLSNRLSTGAEEVNEDKSSMSDDDIYNIVKNLSLEEDWQDAKMERRSKIPDDKLIHLHNQFVKKMLEPPLSASLTAIAKRNKELEMMLAGSYRLRKGPNCEALQYYRNQAYYSTILLEAMDVLYRNVEIANKLEAMSYWGLAETSMSFSDGRLSGPPHPIERKHWDEVKPLVAQSGNLCSPDRTEKWDTIGNSNDNDAHAGLDPVHEEAMKGFNTRLQKYFSLQSEYESTNSKESQTFQSFGKASKKDDKSDGKSTNSNGQAKDNTNEEFHRSLQVLHEVLIGKMTIEQVSEAEGKFLPSLPKGPPEVSFVQPVMKEVLNSLGIVLQRARGLTTKEIDGQNKYSPAKTHIQKDRPLQGTEHRMGRVVDKSIVSSKGRFVYLLRDDSMEIPIEVKPSSRSGYSLESLVKECQDQIVGHMAKHLMMGFNFCGVGHDTIASGLVLFETGLWALQLQLVGMGTTEAKIVARKSGYLPIMNKQSLDSWLNLQEPKNQEAWTKILEKTTWQSDVPSGIVALCQIMTCDRFLYAGHKGFDSDILGPMIGYGSFSVVHAGEGNASGKVLKLSRYGLKEGLQHEARILNKLSSILQDGDHADLFPKICDISDFNVTIRYSDVSIHALTMGPRGIPVDVYLSTTAKNERLQKLLNIGKRISDAIEYIHANGIFHNDVSPNNILVCMDTGRAFLSDFGFATEKDEEQVGFIGTPQYCHRSIFEKYPSSKWNPDPIYDKTSLAFCVASLVDDDGVCPWPYYHPTALKEGKDSENRALERELFVEWVRERSETALTKLTELRNLISHENSTEYEMWQCQVKEDNDFTLDS